jgi:hypothetical protein
MQIRKPNRVTTPRAAVIGGRKTNRATCPRRRNRWSDSARRSRAGR